MFDRAQMFHFARYDKCRCQTGLTGATGTSDAVHVAFRILRHIVVVDMRYAADIKTARRHIGSDQKINRIFTELTHDFITFRLRQVTVQTFRRITAFL